MKSVRIISGRFGGRKIAAPNGHVTHPMGERVRNALFNNIGDEIVGARVLDAFAGSGSVGIEALSRRAREVVFVERDPEAVKALERNIKLLNIADEVRIIRKDVKSWHDRGNEDLFDIIFCDPPYEDMQLSTVIMLFQHLKPNALMVLSQPGRGESLLANGVVVVDNRSYGNAALTFYRREK